MEATVCSSCKKEIPAASKFCSHCGRSTRRRNFVTSALVVRQDTMALRRHMQTLWPVFAAFGLIVVGVMLGSRSSQQPTRPPETPESIEPTAPIPASPAEAKEREITEEDAGKPGDPDL